MIYATAINGGDCVTAANYNGKHRVLVEVIINDILERTCFDKRKDIHRKLVTALAGYAANKIDLYMRHVLEFELGSLSEVLENVNLDYIMDSDELYIAILKKYPGLEPLVDHLGSSLIENFTLIIKSFEDAEFELVSNGYLSSVNNITNIFLLSDESHDANKNIVLFYDSYKPAFALKLRNITLEKQTNDFISGFLRENMGFEDWNFPNYLDHGEVGWVSWRPRQDLNSEKQITESYFRSGVLASISCALGITDLNHENIIIHAGSPVIVDLETTLHHCVEGGGSTNALRTGLFPSFLKLDRNGSPTEESCGIGNIFPEYRLKSKNNEVCFDNKIASPIDYIEYIKQGLRLGFAKVIQYKEKFVDHIVRIENFRTRFIFKATYSYATIIESSMHPALLKSAVIREEYITQCFESENKYVEGDEAKWGEIKACYLGDVPRFITTANSLILDSYYQQTPTTLRHICTGVSRTLQYLQDLNDKIVDEEIFYIEKSYAEAYRVMSVNAKSYEIENYQKLINCANEFALNNKMPVFFMPRNDYCLELKSCGLDIFSGIGGIVYLAAIKKLPVESTISDRIIANYIERLNSTQRN
ncbi:hypothetical protein GCM10017624_41630 [Azotobacter vinelandii]|nr:hypothetical protein GCM10017624_41630 [Azotobacter vinelandii]